MEVTTATVMWGLDARNVGLVSTCQDDSTAVLLVFLLLCSDGRHETRQHFRPSDRRADRTTLIVWVPPSLPSTGRSYTTYGLVLAYNTYALVLAYTTYEPALATLSSPASFILSLPLAVLRLFQLFLLAFPLASSAVSVSVLVPSCSASAIRDETLLLLLPLSKKVVVLAAAAA